MTFEQGPITATVTGDVLTVRGASVVTVLSGGPFEVLYGTPFGYDSVMSRLRSLTTGPYGGAAGEIVSEVKLEFDDATGARVRFLVAPENAAHPKRDSYLWVLP